MPDTGSLSAGRGTQGTEPASTLCIVLCRPQLTDRVCRAEWLHHPEVGLSYRRRAHLTLREGGLVAVYGDGVVPGHELYMWSAPSLHFGFQVLGRVLGSLPLLLAKENSCPSKGSTSGLPPCSSRFTWCRVWFEGSGVGCGLKLEVSGVV